MNDPTTTGRKGAPEHAVHRMVGINHAIRTVSFAYCFFVLGVVGLERGFGAGYFAMLALQFLAYPQIAWLHARRSANSKRAEIFNLYLDAALLGAWVAGLHFPTWILYAGLFSTSLNAVIVRGASGALCSVGFFGVGAAAAVAVLGYGHWAGSSTLVTSLCVAGSLAYAFGVGWVANAQRRALRRSEALHRMITSHAADLIALVDAEGRWQYHGASYEALLRAQDLAPGASAFARLHPDDALRARGALMRALASGRAETLPARLVDRDGRLRKLQMRVQAIETADGRRDGALLVSHDLTELRASEERILIAAQALEGLTEAIVVTTADGTIQSVNRAFTEITGWRRDQVVGRNEHMLRDALEPPGFHAAVEAALSTEGHWSGSTWGRRASGAVYREWRSVRQVPDATGVVTHRVTVFFEIDAPQNAALREAG